MKEYVIAEKSELTAIADAIRAKTGSTDTYSVVEMPEAISQIESGGSETEYIIGQPFDITLATSNWNGSRYSVKISGYNAGEYGVQIGIPSHSSVINTQTMIESALTVSDYSSTAANAEKNIEASVDIVIAAVNVPSVDLAIWLFGLEVAE